MKRAIRLHGRDLPLLREAQRAIAFSSVGPDFISRQTLAPRPLLLFIVRELVKNTINYDKYMKRFMAQTIMALHIDS